MREHGVLARILLIYDEMLAQLNKGTDFLSGGARRIGRTSPPVR